MRIEVTRLRARANLDGHFTAPVSPQMPRRIPLNALAAFEAVARTGSITLAAAGLGVAPTSVGRMIRNFEASLGFALFHRKARGTVLTGEGRLLYETTRRALGRIRSVRQAHAESERELVITTLPSVAAHWLPGWIREAEKSGLRIAVDASLEMRKPGEHAFDVSIRYGEGNWPGMSYRPLFPGREVAVAIPSIAQRFAPADLSSAWPQACMLHDRYFDSWYRWCSVNLGDTLPASQGNVVFDDRVMLVEATLAGAGVALLPDPLVVEHLRTGALQLLPAKPIFVTDTYYIAVQPRALAAESEDLLEFIVRRAGHDYGWLSQRVSERS